MSEAEQPLVGGRSTEGVVQIGDSVHRPSGAWTATVQVFLHHLRSNGFVGAPEPRGFDAKGRDVLSFIPGDVLATPQTPDGPLVLVPYPVAWRSAGALAAAGRLIRSLHDASAGFKTSHAIWRLYDRPMGGDEIICHGDLGPWNTVYVDGLPVAFIDWDSSRPDLPLLDLASAAWHFVPLAGDAETRALGFDSIDYGARLHVFLDAYGLQESSGFVEALRHVKQREADNVRFREVDPSEATEYLQWIAEQLRWLAQHEYELRKL